MLRKKKSIFSHTRNNLAKKEVSMSHFKHWNSEHLLPFQLNLISTKKQEEAF